MPDVAVSWASVGHVTAPPRANAVVAATATTSDASTGRASIACAAFGATSLRYWTSRTLSDLLDPA